MILGAQAWRKSMASLREGSYGERVDRDAEMERGVAEMLLLCEDTEDEIGRAHV